MYLALSATWRRVSPCAEDTAVANGVSVSRLRGSAKPGGEKVPSPGTRGRCEPQDHRLEHVKGNNNHCRRSPFSRARRARATSKRRRGDCFPWALRSSIVARARSLHRRRYRSIAVLSLVSEFRRTPRDSLATELTADSHPFFIPYQQRGTPGGPGAPEPLDADFLWRSSLYLRRIYISRFFSNIYIT